MSAFCLSSLPFASSSITRLNPVPTGSTNTRSVNASQESSLWTRRGGCRGSVPSGGNATRRGPAAPMCRYADEAPGPPLKTNVTGRASSVCATYATEKISAVGFSFLRSSVHVALAV